MGTVAVETDRQVAVVAQYTEASIVRLSGAQTSVEQSSYAVPATTHFAAMGVTTTVNMVDGQELDAGFVAASAAIAISSYNRSSLLPSILSI
jgi:hypothetical protein